MMSMFRKLSQLSKKRVCGVLFTICLISPFFVVSASAENVETNVLLNTWILPQYANGDTIDWNLNDTASVSIPRVNNQSVASMFTIDMNSQGPYANVRQLKPTLTQFRITSSTGFYGEIGFYLSYYYVSNVGEWWNADSENGIFVTVTDARGVELATQIDVEHFVPNTSNFEGSASVGITTSFNVTVPEATPYISISFGYTQGYFPSTLTFEEGTYSAQLDTYVPSAALIIDRTSEELLELQNIVNIIMNQNNINSQYYGDIISKVDSLYTEVGNLADLQEQAIQQFDDWNVVTNVPGSVQNKVDKADQVIADINSLVKPDPEQIVPDYLPGSEDLHDISDILSPFFQNALIVQLCTMVLGFAFVSYVLFGKKG